MSLRRRLVATMLVLVAVVLVVVDVITLTSLRSYLNGKIDDQLTVASVQISDELARADVRGTHVTTGDIQSRVSSDVFVEVLDPTGKVLVSKPSGFRTEVDPAPRLPVPLPVRPAPDIDRATKPYQPYRPDSTSVDVPSRVRSGPEYRLQATSLPGGTLIVATPLSSVDATITSQRNIELAASVAVLIALAIVISLLMRRGLRPLEDMTIEADAIAAGDLTRRLQPAEGASEVGRLGRALNGMLTQIETAFAQRARSEERLRSFLADASHELRTPLTSIRGYAELLRKDALASDEARERALSRIEQEAARMGALVGDLAVLAREGGGLEPDRQRVDLAAVATRAVADARTVDSTRPIVLSVAGEVPVFADAARLEQLVHNLLRNALAHTPPGTPVDVRVEVRGTRALLVVSDRGPGMTEEQASRIFDRFYRGDAERRDGGSGLGLFIVATIARSFGGEARVRTAPGAGADFEVELPLDGGSGEWRRFGTDGPVGDDTEGGDAADPDGGVPDPEHRAQAGEDVLALRGRPEGSPT